MKKGTVGILLLFIVVLNTETFAGNQISQDTLTFGRFGTVHLYRSSANPASVVLFVSGDGGWNKGVVDMAKSLAQLDALVIGIDIIHYLKQLDSSKGECSYPAGDFEALSQYIQKRLDLPTYTIPTLVGYSSGATLVYALIVQAPTNTFLGAMSLGFCPDLEITKPFCKGQGLEFGPGPKNKGFSFKPCPTLKTPWVVLQGTIDQVCDNSVVDAYCKGMPNTDVIDLPKVGHGFSVPRNWLPQFEAAFTKIQRETQIDRVPKEGELKGLPLVEVPAIGKEKNFLAVIISGDGGWASIDRQIGDQFAAEGVPVVGLNALKYFWNRRTPEEASGDLNRIIRYYLDKWQKQSVILVGYSRGADVLPFMANRLSHETLARVNLIALLAPEKMVDFQFHLTDWLGGSHKTDMPTLPEVEKLKGTKVLCFCGGDEKESLCLALDSSLARTTILKGGHHFDGDYASIGKAILEEALNPSVPAGN
jgi:type IV secretory pathway VirJ component